MFVGKMLKKAFCTDYWGRIEIFFLYNTFESCYQARGNRSLTYCISFWVSAGSRNVFSKVYFATLNSESLQV